MTVSRVSVYLMTIPPGGALISHRTLSSNDLFVMDHRELYPSWLPDVFIAFGVLFFVAVRASFPICPPIYFPGSDLLFL